MQYRLLEKITVTRLFNELPAFMEHGGSLPRSREPAKIQKYLYV